MVGSVCVSEMMLFNYNSFHLGLNVLLVSLGCLFPCYCDASRRPTVHITCRQESYPNFIFCFTLYILTIFWVVYYSRGVIHRQVSALFLRSLSTSKQIAVLPPPGCIQAGGGPVICLSAQASCGHLMAHSGVTHRVPQDGATMVAFVSYLVFFLNVFFSYVSISISKVILLFIFLYVEGGEIPHFGLEYSVYRKKKK